jgi:hypothetical protein
MIFRAVLAGAAVVATAAPALAQPSPAPAAEIPRPLPLPPDKQNLIREQAKRPDLPSATLPEPARIDMVVPPEVELLALPQDVATEVPSVTRYRYLKAGDVIAIVDPETRKVIQLIRP